LGAHKIVFLTPPRQIARAAGQLGRPAAAAQLAIQTGAANPNYSAIIRAIPKTEFLTPSITLESLRAGNDKIAAIVDHYESSC